MAAEDKNQQSINPYQPPLEAQLVPSLSLLERKTLEFFLIHRWSPPTVLGLIGERWWRWLLSGVAMFLLALTSVVLYVIDAALGPELTYSLTSAMAFIGGVMFGEAAITFSIYRRLHRLWPMYCDILDWGRIEERLKD